MPKIILELDAEEANLLGNAATHSLARMNRDHTEATLFLAACVRSGPDALTAVINKVGYAMKAAGVEPTSLGVK